jgi:ketosteroid isomerase-like protein
MTHRRGKNAIPDAEETMLAGTLTLAATIAAAFSVSGPLAAANDDVDALLATDKRMQRAFVDRDVAALERIIPDDYVLIASSGAERRKPAILAEVASPDVVYEINESSDWSVHVHGDTAIVVALLHQKGIDHGEPFDYSVRFSDTYVRENGAWRNVHAHATRVPAKALG